MSDMNQYFYLRNRNCSCARCRCRGLMGAVILITLGVLFALQEYMYIRFERTWPVILVVIGICSLVGRTASTEGHVQPFGPGGPGAPPPASSQDPWASGRVPSSPTTPTSPGQKQNDQQVKQ